MYSYYKFEDTKSGRFQFGRFCTGGRMYCPLYLDGEVKDLEIMEMHLQLLPVLILDLTTLLPVPPASVKLIPIYIVNRVHFTIAGGTKVVWREGKEYLFSISEKYDFDDDNETNRIPIHSSEFPVCDYYSK